MELALYPSWLPYTGNATVDGSTAAYGTNTFAPNSASVPVQYALSPSSSHTSVLASGDCPPSAHAVELRKASLTAAWGGRPVPASPIAHTRTGACAAVPATFCGGVWNVQAGPDGTPVADSTVYWYAVDGDSDGSVAATSVPAGDVGCAGRDTAASAVARLALTGEYTTRPEHGAALQRQRTDTEFGSGPGCRYGPLVMFSGRGGGDAVTVDVLDRDRDSDGVGERERVSVTVVECDAVHVREGEGEPVADFVSDGVVEGDVVSDRDIDTDLVSDRDVDTDVVSDRDVVTDLVSDRDIDTEVVSDRDVVTEVVSDRDIDSDLVFDRDVVTEVVSDRDIDTEIVSDRDIDIDIVSDGDEPLDSEGNRDTVLDRELLGDCEGRFSAFHRGRVVAFAPSDATRSSLATASCKSNASVGVSKDDACTSTATMFVPATQAIATLWLVSIAGFAGRSARVSHVTLALVGRLTRSTSTPFT